MKVAIYARVSTEEQARHGISIEAQMDALRKWASDQNHEVVGEYIDNGVSARKSPSKRPELQRLLNDLPALKTELVAFCKLDRWTRNVKGYYQVQEVLDHNKVAWIAIQEDYETITASGRFKVNIMLSVAENEADRTSERIKSVFEHKVNLGQAINGAVPLGFRIEGKRFAHSEDKQAVVAAFEEFAKHGNKSAIRDMLQFKYGARMSFTGVTRMLKNRLYIGEYRGNPNYCEPIIPRTLFDRVQHDLECRPARNAPSNRTYLFSGLIICNECGRRMSVARAEDRIYYRCNAGHYTYKDCPNSTFIGEAALEASALTQLSDLVANLAVEYQRPVQKSPEIDAASIQRKLDRLKDLYIEGDITKEKYRQQRDQLTALLTVKSEKPSNVLPIVGTDFEANYKALDRPERKLFWRQIIDKIIAGADGSVDIYFS